MFRDLNKVYAGLKQSAKKRGIGFYLKRTDLDDIGQPISCPILGIPLNYKATKQEDNSPSFDRINSNKPYVKSNVIVVSWRANRIKNNATVEELRMLLEYYDGLDESPYG